MAGGGKRANTAHPRASQRISIGLRSRKALSPLNEKYQIPDNDVGSKLVGITLDREKKNQGQQLQCRVSQRGSVTSSRCRATFTKNAFRDVLLGAISL
ncbi:hypothetical protein NPIL_348891 [Nephila pilipes]|uniref:Uncharacterized protein n=1 Tax=Nephila pilipes TaxID=299642 RepID=A0A8X6NJ07_NEPPI|nr:hypothetical protein NPIL_348891 [Nephila pilipes]